MQVAERSHEKKLNIIIHQGNANQSYDELVGCMHTRLFIIIKEKMEIKRFLKREKWKISSGDGEKIVKLTPHILQK